MNEHDVMCQVRASFSGLHMDTPVENVLARSRARRRRQVSGLTAATAATAGAAVAVTLAVGGTAPAHSAGPPSASPPSASAGTGHASSGSPRAVTLAAFSVTSGPGDKTTLILRKGSQYQLDPSALRQALAQHGIPALVTVGTFCRSASPASAGLGQVLQPLSQDNGEAMAINGQAMPPGTRLSIGYFSSYVKLELIEDGSPLSCSSTDHQPAVHITPSGTPIRG
jgi:hypothetical protein